MKCVTLNSHVSTQRQRKDAYLSVVKAAKEIEAGRAAKKEPNKKKVRDAQDKAYKTVR